MKPITQYDQLKPWQVKFIVRLMADFVKINKIRGHFELTYGRGISQELIAMMHPEYMPEGNILPKQMQDYFWELRTELYGSVEYPVCNLINRIKILDRLRIICQANESHDTLVKVLELAQRETGPLYQDIVKGIKELRGSDIDVATKTFEA